MENCELLDGGCGMSKNVAKEFLAVTEELSPASSLPSMYLALETFLHRECRWFVQGRIWHFNDAAAIRAFVSDVEDE